MTRDLSAFQTAGFTQETWLTPRHIIQALGPFDLDPCAAPSPRPWATADRHIELPDNGLSAEWIGRVWLNPPYGAEARRWMDKLAEHGDGVALIFARVDTAMFHDQVWSRADGVLFLRGRITFCDARGKPAKTNGGAPSCLVAYGAKNAALLASGAIDGHWVPLRPRKASSNSLFGAAA